MQSCKIMGGILATIFPSPTTIHMSGI